VRGAIRKGKGQEEIKTRMIHHTNCLKMAIKDPKSN